MARPKQFAPDEALDDAMRLFWEKGYEATSMQDLVTRMGVHKRSMYDTYGDKHALFLKALSRYAEGQDARVREAAQATGPATEAIRALLETALPDTTGQQPAGCLVVNSATELGAHDAEAAAFVDRHVAMAHDVLRDLVERGQHDGEIATHLDAATLATLLNNAWLGLRVQSRAGASRDEVQRGVDAAVALLAP